MSDQFFSSELFNRSIHSNLQRFRIEVNRTGSGTSHPVVKEQASCPAGRLPSNREFSTGFQNVKGNRPACPAPIAAARLPLRGLLNRARSQIGALSFDATPPVRIPAATA